MFNDLQSARITNRLKRKKQKKKTPKNKTTQFANLSEMHVKINQDNIIVYNQRVSMFAGVQYTIEN